MQQVVHHNNNMQHDTMRVADDPAGNKDDWIARAIGKAIQAVGAVDLEARPECTGMLHIASRMLGFAHCLLHAVLVHVVAYCVPHVACHRGRRVGGHRLGARNVRYTYFPSAWLGGWSLFAKFVSFE